MCVCGMYCRTYVEVYVLAVRLRAVFAMGTYNISLSTTEVVTVGTGNEERRSRHVSGGFTPRHAVTLKHASPQREVVV